jgi:hypothetical protein
VVRIAQRASPVEGSALMRKLPFATALGSSKHLDMPMAYLSIADACIQHLRG